MSAVDIVKEFWTGYWTDGDRDVFERLVAPDVRIRNEFAGEALTRTDLIELHEGLRRLWRSVSVEMPDIVAQDDQVAAILRLTGTRSDGEVLMVEGATVMRVADGRIVEDLTRFDTYEILIRLGRIDPSTALLSLT